MWMPEDDGGEAIEDDLTSNNGWRAHDMFAKVSWAKKRRQIYKT